MSAPEVVTSGQERGAARTNAGQPAAIRAFLLPLALDDAISEVFCLFSHHQVVEVLGRRPVQRIPFSPAYLQGVINYFGQLLPVMGQWFHDVGFNTNTKGAYYGRVQGGCEPFIVANSSTLFVSIHGSSANLACGSSGLAARGSRFDRSGHPFAQIQR